MTVLLESTGARVVSRVPRSSAESVRSHFAGGAAASKRRQKRPHRSTAGQKAERPAVALAVVPICPLSPRVTRE